MANYKNFTGTNQVKVGFGKLRSVFVANTSSGTLTIYDSDKSSTSDPVIIGAQGTSGATRYAYSMGEGIAFNKGLYIVVGGTLNATVSYE